MREDARGGASEVTYATTIGTQSFSMAQEPGVGSQKHHKGSAAIARPRLLDGTRASSRISQKEYYLDTAGVIGEATHPGRGEPRRVREEESRRAT